MSHDRHPLFTLQTQVESNPEVAMGNLHEILSFLRPQTRTRKKRILASQVLVDLAKACPGHPELVRAVDDIVALLHNQEDAVLVNLSATIGHTAVAEPAKLVELERAGQTRVVAAMEDLLTVDHPRATANAAETLARLAQADPALVKRIPSANGFGLLFKKQETHRRYALAICERVSKVRPLEIQSHLRHLTEQLRLDRNRLEQGAVLVILARLAANNPESVIPAADLICDTAQTRDSIVRGNALGVAVVLAKHRPGEVRSLRGVAAEALSDDELAVRANAAELLYLLARSAPDGIDHPGIRRRLEDATEDPESSVNQFAKMALEATANKRRPGPSLNSITQELLEDTGVWTFLEEVEGIVQPMIQINDFEDITDARQDISIDDSDIGGDVANEQQAGSELGNKRADIQTELDGDSDQDTSNEPTDPYDDRR